MTYDGVTYTATYTFQVTPAWIAPQPITYRYFACLYNNTNGAISQRSGASLDVVSWWQPDLPRVSSCTAVREAQARVQPHEAEPQSPDPIPAGTQNAQQCCQGASAPEEACSWRNNAPLLRHVQKL